MLEVTRRPFGSYTVTSGLPGVAISPASVWRWATKPVSGETMLAWLAAAPAAPEPACAAL
jgi:hypothetical protein